MAFLYNLGNKRGSEVREEMGTVEKKIAEMFALHQKKTGAEVETLTKEIAEMKVDLDRLKTGGEMRALGKKIAETIVADRAIGAEMKALRKDIAGMRADPHRGQIGGEIETLKKEIAETIAQQRMQIAGEIETLAKEIAGTKSGLDRLTNSGEMKALGKKIAETIIADRAIGAEMKALRKEIAGMRAEPHRERTGAEFEALKKEIAETIAQQRRQITGEMEALTKEIAGTKSGVDRITNSGDMKALGKKMAETIAADKAISGEMKALKKEIAGMRADPHGKQTGSEVGTLKKELAETIAQQRMQITREMEALTKEIAWTKSGLDRITNSGEMKALGKKMAETIASDRAFGGEIKALKKEVSAIRTHVAERQYGVEIQNLKEEIAKSALEGIKVQGDVNVLTKEITGMKTDVERIRNGGEMKALEKKIKETISVGRIEIGREMEVLKKEIAGMKTDLRRATKIGEEIKSLETKIREKNAVDRVNIDGEMEVLRKEMARMKTDIEAKNPYGEMKALRKDIDGIKTDLSRRKSSEEMDKCESWRLKGNEAYEEGDMVKAEEYYTKSVNCLPGRDHLLLCYSNRAIARMRQGKVRDALRDCKAAAEIDPYFLKHHTTAANCHLQLGEVETAVECFRKCSESGDYVCLDRRIILEAADGLEKAQKVEEYRKNCEQLMQQRTSDSTANAFSMISDALAISPFSEKLLELKGNALLMLQKYEKAIQLCENTLPLAEKNFPAESVEANVYCSQTKNFVKLWRLHVMSKAYFHLGRLERTLVLLKERELLRSGSNIQDSSTLLAFNVREILKHKKAGDEAYIAESYLEATKRYTAALSRSTGSRPVMAVCFCNRAAAHVKLGQFANAIADCNLAIILCGNYSEAIFVRAASFIRVRDYAEAANDISKLISALEMQPPGNFESSNVSEALACCSVEDLQGARSSLLSATKMAVKGISLDVYLILGNHKSDTAPEIRKAYREAALRHHPDKVVGKFLAESGDDGQLGYEIADEIRQNADILFKMIAEAYDVVSNPTKRSVYDIQEEGRKAEESKGNGNFPVPTAIRKMLEDLGFI